MSDLGIRFDWYSATLPEGHRTAGVDVVRHLGDVAPSRVKGLYGYARGWQIRREGDVVATVMEAPNRPDFMWASGSHAPAFASVVRAHVPDHAVPRADVCWDFGGGDAGFALVRAQAFDLLSRKVTMTDHVSHDLTGEAAATLYFGSRKQSEMFGRLYRSGLVHEELDPSTNRMEYECKPQKPERKRHLAGLEPAEVVGWSRWSRSLTEVLVGIVAPAAPPRSARVSDRDRALNTLAAQYGRRLWELCEFHGGDVESAMIDLLNRVPS